MYIQLAWRPGMCTAASCHSRFDTIALFQVVCIYTRVSRHPCAAAANPPTSPGGHTHGVLRAVQALQGFTALPSLPLRSPASTPRGGAAGA